MEPRYSWVAMGICLFFVFLLIVICLEVANETGIGCSIVSFRVIPWSCISLKDVSVLMCHFNVISYYSCYVNKYTSMSKSGFE